MLRVVLVIVAAAVVLLAGEAEGAAVRVGQKERRGVVVAVASHRCVSVSQPSASVSVSIPLSTLLSPYVICVSLGVAEPATGW